MSNARLEGRVNDLEKQVADLTVRVNTLMEGHPNINRVAENRKRDRDELAETRSKFPWLTDDDIAE